MRDERFFKAPRILVRQIVSGNPPRIFASFTASDLYFTQIGFGIIPNEEIDVKYLLSLLNSCLINFYHKYRFLDVEKDLFQKILIANCKQLPIKVIPKPKQQPFIEKADKILSLNSELQIIINKFISYLSGQYRLEKLTIKLEKWHDLQFLEFIKELNKAIKVVKGVPLTKKDEFEWIDLFNENRLKAQLLLNQIDQTDKEIDKMVYELYELTEEEIQIIES